MLRQPMEVWFYSRNRNHSREANTRAEGKEFYTRAPPERLRRAFCLLTQTYHGSRITGNLGTGTHMSGKRVNQELTVDVTSLRTECGLYHLNSVRNLLSTLAANPTHNITCP